MSSVNDGTKTGVGDISLLTVSALENIPDGRTRLPNEVLSIWKDSHDDDDQAGHTSE